MKKLIVFVITFSAFSWYWFSQNQQNSIIIKSNTQTSRVMDNIYRPLDKENIENKNEPRTVASINASKQPPPVITKQENAKYIDKIKKNLKLTKKQLSALKIEDYGFVKNGSSKGPISLVHVKISYPLKNTRNSFHAFVDPTSGKILETWGKPVWEKHPLRDLKFTVN